MQKMGGLQTSALHIGQSRRDCCKMSSFCFAQRVGHRRRSGKQALESRHHPSHIAPHRARGVYDLVCFSRSSLSAGGRSSRACASVASVRRRRLHVAEPCSTANRDTLSFCRDRRQEGRQPSWAVPSLHLQACPSGKWHLESRAPQPPSWKDGPNFGCACTLRLVC